MVRGVYLVATTPLLLVSYAGCVLFSEGSFTEVFENGVGSNGSGDPDLTLTVSSMVKSCLAGAGPFLPCVNERAMVALERTESMDTVLLDSGLETVRQPGDENFGPRGVYSFGDNSYNVGAVIEAASSLLSRRIFRWDLSTLYPGLRMRIGPTYNGRGMIDFIIDPRLAFDGRNLGYGHMIFKRAFLPNVLALQISIASAIPLIIAAFYFLTKKAFILSKIALVITSVAGYGSLILQHTNKPVVHTSSDYHPMSGYRPVPNRHPAGGHHNGFVGDIRGDKFYGNFDGFQQISSSNPSSLFQAVNYFPQEDDTTNKNHVERNKKESE